MKIPRSALRAFPVVAMALLTLNACATIARPRGRQKVSIAMPENTTKFRIVDVDSLQQVAEGDGASTVVLKRRAGVAKGRQYRVLFEKDGVVTQFQDIEPRASAWYVLGNLVFPGLWGWGLVDPLSGAMWALAPRDVRAISDPGVSASPLPGPTPERVRASLFVRKDFVLGTIIKGDEAIRREDFLSPPAISNGLESSAVLTSVGMSVPLNTHWNAGWTVGSLTVESDAHAQVPGISMHAKYRVHVRRITSELQQQWHLGGPVYASIRAGVGVAGVRRERRNDIDYLGPLGFRDAQFTEENDFVPTGDIAPTLTLKYKRLALDVGGSYLYIGPVTRSGNIPEATLSAPTVRAALSFAF